MTPRLAAFLKLHEGCRLTAYQDSGGVWTIGHGHARGVTAGQTITQAEADELLAQDVARAEAAVDSLVDVPLTAAQHDALAAWTFNCGVGNLASSTLLQRLNAGAYDEVPEQLMRWDHVHGGVVAGLRNRREAECEMWKETA